MSERGFAWLALAAAAALCAAGLFLARRFRSPEDEGEPRIQPAGPPLRPFVELAGKLLTVFGLCAAGLALMTLFAQGASNETRHEVEVSSAAAAPKSGRAVESGGGIQVGAETTAPAGRSQAGGSGHGSMTKASSQAPAKTPAARSASAASGWNSRLSGVILDRAGQVSREINRTGGYRFDGRNDCYGFVRRVWDPVLSGMGLRTLPVSDAVSRQWAPIVSWADLKPGDVLATHQGHMWGPRWHGGLFAGFVAGKAYSFDNSPSNRGGAYARPAPPGLFRFYHLPTHQLLLKK